MSHAAPGEDGGEGSVPPNATERLLGYHPETGEPVTVRLGPYGLYVQQGEVDEQAVAAAAAAKKAAKKKAAAAAKKAKKSSAKGKKGTGANGSEEEEGRALVEGAGVGEVEAALEEQEVEVKKPKRASIPKAKVRRGTAHSACRADMSVRENADTCLGVPASQLACCGTFATTVAEMPELPPKTIPCTTVLYDGHPE